MTFGGFEEIPAYLSIYGGILLGNLTINDSSPGLFFEGGSALIGTIDNHPLQFETDGTVAGGFDIPGITNGKALYLGGSVAAVKAAISSTFFGDLYTFNLGISTVDSTNYTSPGVNQVSSVVQSYVVDGAANQNFDVYKSTYIGYMALSPVSPSTIYNGVYSGMLFDVVNTNAIVNTGSLIGATFFAQAFSFGFTKSLIGGEFGSRSYGEYGYGEVSTCIGGAFDVVQTTGTGSTVHLAAGCLVGVSNSPYSYGISCTGSTTSNTAVGVYITPSGISATGTAASAIGLWIGASALSATTQYAIKVDDTSQNQFAGSVSSLTRFLSGGAVTATNTTLVTKDGNWKTTQTTAPTTTVNANAGTGATASIAHGTDVAGQLTLTTTATSPASGAQVTVNFNKTYNIAPIVSLTPASANAASLAVSSGVYVTSATSGFSVNFASTDSIGHAYVWNYICLETQ